MLDRAQTLQDFTELAKQTLVGHGLTPSDAWVKSAGKMLQRLADPSPASPSSLPEPSTSLTHAAMLSRCAAHDAA